MNPTTSTAASANPLLDPPGLPAYDRIQPEHVVPAVERRVADTEAAFERLEREAEPTWDGLVAPLERLLDGLEHTWRVVSHLVAVKNSPALREAHRAVQGKVVALTTRVAQSQALFRRMEQLRSGPEWERLDAPRRRVVELELRDARLAGVALEGADRERFGAIQLELAELATEFSNHVLDSVKTFELVLREREEVAGLPPSALESAAAAARRAGHPAATAERGPWRFSLDGPSYLSFMRDGARRDLREQLHRAFVARASAGQHDNAPLIDRILALRAEKARLLGFASYAELSLASKMAPDVAAVDDLLERLRAVARPRAEAELAELVALAAERGAPEAEDFRPWDQLYWAERLRQQRYEYDDETLREYFPEAAVLEGLFALAERLFGVRVAPADGEVPVWHPDVRYFRLLDDAGAELAAFYLDAYTRPSEKRGGAWQSACLGRSRALAPDGAALRRPVANIVCNAAPPAGERPALLGFSEVRTLFHEFGHALQHMLTTVDEGLVAGTRNVEWDAVEVASQFMENWLYHRETLVGLARHWRTGAPLPDELFERVHAARRHMAGSDMVRQLLYGTLDLELHARYDPAGGETPFDVQRRAAARTVVLPQTAGDRTLCGFAHIFSGSYAAGYYSYKWAEVLSADAFAAFEEAGLEDSRAVAETGRRYRETILALGGSRPAMEVFKRFRGREPEPEALLRHAGLTG